MNGATATVLKDHKFAIKVVLHAYVVRDVLGLMTGDEYAVDVLSEHVVVDVVVIVPGEVEICGVKFACERKEPAPAERALVVVDDVPELDLDVIEAAAV